MQIIHMGHQNIIDIMIALISFPRTDMTRIFN